MAGSSFAEFIAAVRAVEGEFANQNELLAVLIENASDPNISAESIRRAADKRRQAGSRDQPSADLFTAVFRMMERGESTTDVLDYVTTQIQERDEQERREWQRRQRRAEQARRRWEQERRTQQTEARRVVEYRAAALRRAVAERRRLAGGRQRGHDELYHDLYDLDTAQIILAGIEVVERDLTPQKCWGISHGGCIDIEQSIPFTDKLGTLFHELAHEVDLILMGGWWGNISSAVIEFHADSVTQILLRQHGLETPRYRDDRIAGYRRQIANVPASLRRVEQITEHCLGILGFHQRTW